MIAALCSLVTSTKLASSDGSPLESSKKMERDALDVLLKAEAFCEYAASVAVVPKRVKPFFMTPRDGEGDGRFGGGWTSNLGRASLLNSEHLEQLLGEMEVEKDNIDRCVKAMNLPGTGSSSRGRKNSLVIVDDHLIIPFMLIAIQVNYSSLWF